MVQYKLFTEFTLKGLKNRLVRCTQAFRALSSHNDIKRIKEWLVHGSLGEELVFARAPVEV